MNEKQNKTDPVLLTVRCGLFAALITVGTLISFPIAGGQGFVNLGDAVIHISVIVIGGWPASAVAAIGSALADIILGYAIYAPGTVIIKALMAFVGTLCLKKLRFKPLAFIISGLIMPIGYLLYELLLSTFGAWESTTAFIALPWNLLQYAVAVILAVIAHLIIPDSLINRS